MVPAPYPAGKESFMSRFRHALQDRDQHIRSLRIISAVLAGFLLLACIGWMTAPSR
ncbi:TIGR03746 family integrating conjugative element protein, partial [Escherichia coli]|nr:TIGR03746 family integrating conjugative element protein [Escherichia coli]MED9662875.1 TIGR03746 family integrating conjugative element protein [Escherichia coli]